MGLRFLGGYYKSTYRGISSDDLESVKGCDNFFMQMNLFVMRFVHSGSNYTPMEDRDLMKRVLNQLDQIVDLICPKKMLYLSFDGVVPASKMMLRRNSIHSQTAEKNRYLRCLKEARESDLAIPERLAERFDNNSLLSGSDFMHKFMSALFNHVQNRIADKWSHLSVVISDHNVPGLALKKICDFVRSQKYKKTEKNVLLSVENLALICLFALNQPNFYILRTKTSRDCCFICLSPTHATPECNYSDAKKNLTEIRPFDFNPQYEVFDMDHLKERILQDFSGKILGHKISKETVWNDYVYLFHFLIDDFSIDMHFKTGFQKDDITTLLTFYRDHSHTLTEKGRPLPRLIKQFFYDLCADKKYYPYVLRELEMEEKCDDYNKRCFDNTDLAFRKAVVLQYFKGICWIRNFLYEGPTDWNFVNRHHHLPHIFDIANLIPDKIPQFNDCPGSINLLEQFTIILPPSSKALAPLGWHHIYERNKGNKLSEHMYTYDDFDLEQKAKYPFIDVRAFSNVLKEMYHLLPRTVKGTFYGKDSLIVNENHKLCETLQKYSSEDSKENSYILIDPETYGFYCLASPVTSIPVAGQMTFTITSNMALRYGYKTQNDLSEKLSQLNT